LTDLSKYDIISTESEVVEMVRCPNCGSTAQPKLQEIEEQELTCYTIEVTHTYKCDCGQVFTTKEYQNGEYFNEK
jgi:DNA-directed RNA polymerase subunit RPC12/RpoP